MTHFDSLRDSKTSVGKYSSTTDTSDYQHVFELYSKKHSQIDDIINTFDNGQLLGIFE